LTELRKAIEASLLELHKKHSEWLERTSELGRWKNILSDEGGLTLIELLDYLKTGFVQDESQIKSAIASRREAALLLALANESGIAEIIESPEVRRADAMYRESEEGRLESLIALGEKSLERDRLKVAEKIAKAKKDRVRREHEQEQKRQHEITRAKADERASRLRDVELEIAESKSSGNMMTIGATIIVELICIFGFPSILTAINASWLRSQFGELPAALWALSGWWAPALVTFLIGSAIAGSSMAALQKKKEEILRDGRSS
jgi:hypothetical protein